MSHIHDDDILKTQTPAAAGLIAGRYKVIRELGRGGMGEVLLVRDTVSGVDFALKRIPEDVARSHQDMEDLRSTYALVYKLSHPHIANYKNLEFDPATGAIYLVMEYVDGLSLDRMIRKDGPFSADAATRLLREVGGALDFAHAKGVLHRDVKPSNILIEPDGTAKLIDFGLAAQVQSSLTRLSVMDTSALFQGTRPYMAPELWKGRVAGKAADQWALAATIYESLCGHTPWVSDDVQILRMCITNDPVDELPAAGAGLWAAISRALSKNPDDRWSSFAEMIQAVDAGDSKPGAARLTAEREAAESEAAEREAAEREAAERKLQEESERKRQEEDRQRRAAEDARQKLEAEEAARSQEETAARRRAEIEEARRREIDLAREEAFEKIQRSEERKNGVLPVLIAIGVVVLFLVAIILIWAYSSPTSTPVETIGDNSSVLTSVSQQTAPPSAGAATVSDSVQNNNQQSIGLATLLNIHPEKSEIEKVLADSPDSVSEDGETRADGLGLTSAGKVESKAVAKKVGRLGIGEMKSGGFCDQGNIEGVVKQRAGAIRACYEQELQLHDGLSGKVAVRWTINLEGKVDAAAVTNSTIGSAKVESCIITVIRRMRFASPEGGICVVQWPFVFSPR